MNHFINTHSHNHAYFTIRQHIYTHKVSTHIKAQKFVSRLNEYYLKRIDFSESHANIPYRLGLLSVLIEFITAQNAHIHTQVSSEFSRILPQAQLPSGLNPGIATRTNAFGS